MELKAWCNATIIKDEQFLNVEKLQQLKIHVRGEAADMLKTIQVLDHNFEIAWTKLDDYYTNKRKLISMYIPNLLDLPSVRWESPSELKSLLNETVNILSAFRSADLYAITGMDSPGKSSGLKFILRQSDSFRFLRLLQSQLFILHFNDFKEKFPTECKTFVTTKGLCFNSLRFHKSADCRNTYRCHDCKGKHYTLLHDPTSRLSNVNSTCTVTFYSAFVSTSMSAPIMQPNFTNGQSINVNLNCQSAFIRSTLSPLHLSRFEIFMAVYTLHAQWSTLDREYVHSFLRRYLKCWNYLEWHLLPPLPELLTRIQFHQSDLQFWIYHYVIAKIRGLDLQRKYFRPTQAIGHIIVPCLMHGLISGACR